MHLQRTTEMFRSAHIRMEQLVENLIMPIENVMNKLVKIVTIKTKVGRKSIAGAANAH